MNRRFHKAFQVYREIDDLTFRVEYRVWYSINNFGNTLNSLSGICSSRRSRKASTLIPNKYSEWMTSSVSTAANATKVD